jgi:hypothetical protein
MLKANMAIQRHKENRISRKIADEMVVSWIGLSQPVRPARLCTFQKRQRFQR